LCATGVPPHCSLLHIFAQVQGEVNKLIPGVEEQIGRLPAVIQAALDEAVEAGRIEGAPITTTNLERTIMKVLEASGIKDIPQLLCQGTRALPSTEELHAQQHTLADFGLRPLASLPRDLKQVASKTSLNCFAKGPTHYRLRRNYMHNSILLLILVSTHSHLCPVTSWFQT